MATTKLGGLKIRATFHIRREAESYKRDLPKSLTPARIRERHVADKTYYDVWTH